MVFATAYSTVMKTARSAAEALHWSARAEKEGRRSANCAASKRHNGGNTGKIRSTRFDGTMDITRIPPAHQQVSQNVSGEICRRASRKRVFPDRKLRTASAIMSTLHGRNLCNR